ncbi:MAG: prolipoprotein diacylglyceryl transferase, partial [Clostridia bacterium]|nr:prolipoprotein diacylglyceryl transferase [Clostridia bacterium]
DYLLWGTIFAIIGARLYYVIFSFENYKDDLISILYIWNGGIAIYGALIGAFVTGFVISKIKKLNPYKIFDLAAIGFLIGQIIGRWGNFVNAEAYGRAFASQNVADLPFWAMGVYINGALTYVHPIFLYESLWNLIGLIVILLIIKPHISFGGEILVFYVGWYGFGRFFTEGLRGGDELYFFSTGIRVSQMLSVILFLTSVAIFLWKFTHKEKTGPLGLSKVTNFKKGTIMIKKVPYLYPEPAAEEEAQNEGSTDENASEPEKTQSVEEEEPGENGEEPSEESEPEEEPEETAEEAESEEPPAEETEEENETSEEDREERE